MTAAILTEKGKQALIDAACKAIEDTPFVKDRDQLFVRYDSLKIENKSGGFFSDGIEIFFCWRGEAVAKIETPRASLKDNVSLNISGIEGRMGLRID
jgi:hypothetical protein